MSPSEIFFKIYFYSHLDAYFFVQNFTENPNCYKNKCALSYNTIIIIIIIHYHSTKFLLPGVPLYGRAFSLMNPNSNRMGAPAKDTSFQVPYLNCPYTSALGCGILNRPPFGGPGSMEVFPFWRPQIWKFSLTKFNNLKFSLKRFLLFIYNSLKVLDH